MLPTKRAAGPLMSVACSGGSAEPLPEGATSGAGVSGLGSGAAGGISPTTPLSNNWRHSAGTDAGCFRNSS